MEGQGLIPCPFVVVLAASDSTESLSQKEMPPWLFPPSPPPN